MSDADEHEPRRRFARGEHPAIREFVAQVAELAAEHPRAQGMPDIRTLEWERFAAQR